MTYIALLRGINVGGNTKVPMEDLRKMFMELGFTNVKTLLNSGNVFFSSNEINLSDATRNISKRLKKKFGKEIGVIIRPQIEIKQLVEGNPFKNITLTPQIRLYVTFLSQVSKSSLKIPYESEEKDFHILRVSNQEICSVLMLSLKRGTVDVVSFIEKEFGKNVTTRSWNTVKKLASIS